MFRKLCLATASIAITLALPVAAPAFGQHAEHSTAGKLVTLSEWTVRMTRLLDQEMRYPRPAFGREAASGMVRVKFNCSEDGRPDKVILLKSSGDPNTDQAALRAVKRLASLHPMPTGFTPEQKFEAVLILASSADDPRLKSTGVELTGRNGWYKDPSVAVRKEQPTTKVAAR